MPAKPVRSIDPGKIPPHSAFSATAFCFAVVAGGCLVLVLALATWNLVTVEILHARNPVPGNFYVVDGHRMHIYCTGSGSPAVLVDAGIGSDWLDWQAVQPQISKLTRICTYDRSGLGWSDPQSGKHDAEAIVRQLHILLDEAGVARPFIFAGHSAGGMFAREYAREFPGEIEAVALVDSVFPHQIDVLPGLRAAYDLDRRYARRAMILKWLSVWSGWARLTGHCSAVVPKNLAFMAGQYKAEQCRPRYVNGSYPEFLDFETDTEEGSRLTSFGRIPVLVLSEDTDRNTTGMDPFAASLLPQWGKEQPKLLSLSPLSWRVIARGSGHNVQIDRPDVVIAEISWLIRYVRGGPPPPFGTTRVE